MRSKRSMAAFVGAQGDSFEYTAGLAYQGIGLSVTKRVWLERLHPIPPASDFSVTWEGWVGPESTRATVALDAVKVQEGTRTGFVYRMDIDVASSNWYGPHC